MKGLMAQSGVMSEMVSTPTWSRVVKVASATLSASLVAGVLLLAAVAILPKLVGLNPVVVLSGSMEPALRVGDIAVTKPVDPSTVQVGDVVTYRSGSGAIFVTHRIIGIEETAQGRLLELKGDNNPAADAQRVPQERVVAKLVYGVPKVGYVVAFVNSQMGLTLLVITPAVVLALMWYRGREQKRAAGQSNS